MGNVCYGRGTDELATRTAESISIDTDIRSAKRKDRLTHRILLLGVSGSGKSTVAKQLKLSYSSGFTEEEVENYKHIILLNVVTGMKALINEAEKLEFKILRKNKKISNTLKTINPYQAEISGHIDDFKQLWDDSGIQKTWERRDEFQVDIPANLEYCMVNLDRIGKIDYVPSKEDILYARQRTTGIVEYQFKMNGVDWTLLDVGGQRTERRKWVHFFDTVGAVIYVASLDEYDLPSPEDPSQSRMQESLKVFDEVINLPTFDPICKILFLNKIDLFKLKIKNRPLKSIFKEYNGTPGYEQSMTFIQDLYLARVKAPKKIFVETKITKLFVHYTCALDTKGMKFVFDSMVQSIMERQMETL